MCVQMYRAASFSACVCRYVGLCLCMHMRCPTPSQAPGAEIDRWTAGFCSVAHVCDAGPEPLRSPRPPPPLWSLGCLWCSPLVGVRKNPGPLSKLKAFTCPSMQRSRDCLLTGSANQSNAGSVSYRGMIAYLLAVLSSLL